MLETASKDAAREEVKKVFNSLKKNVTEAKRASEILKAFTTELLNMKRQSKKGSGTETIMGKYLKGLKITGADKSPISKAVNEFLSEDHDVFKHKSLVNPGDGKINTDIEETQNEVTEKLGKCKKLRSADVLAAMYHVLDKKKIPSVLRLLILGEMFTELGKANGFIKGNQAGVLAGEDELTNIKDIQKDENNKHLGTLATKEIRNLAATIGNEIKKLMADKKWLKKEMGTEKGLDEKTPKDENGNNPEQQEEDTYKKTRQYARQIAIEVLERKMSVEKFKPVNGKQGEPALPVILKPRDTDKGKYKEREKATTKELEQFLKKPANVEAFNILINCANNDKKFKDELNKKYEIENGEVSLRAILNTLASKIYEDNDLDNILHALRITGTQLTQLLLAAETKLEKSHNRDEKRKKINMELKNWVTIITAVEAYKKEIEVAYDTRDTYDAIWEYVVEEIQNTKVKVVDDNGAKLEEKTISQVEKIDVNNETALPGLTDEYKKRLTSLNIGFKEDGDYKTKYKNIITFLAHPTEENLSLTKVKIVEEISKIQITKANWNASTTFDKFVEEKGKALNAMIVEKKGTTPLPPCNSIPVNNILRLTGDEKGYEEFDKPFTWFTKPTLEEVNEAVTDLKGKDYLGKNEDLLHILQGNPTTKKVLGVKTEKYIDVWVAALNKKMTELHMDEKVIVEPKDLSAWDDLDIGIQMYTNQDAKGIKSGVYNDFVKYIKSNANADFIELLKTHEKTQDNIGVQLLTGKKVLLVADTAEEETNNDKQNKGENEQPKNPNNEQAGEGEDGGHENEQKNENTNQQNETFENDDENKNKKDQNNKNENTGGS